MGARTGPPAGMLKSPGPLCSASCRTARQRDVGFGIRLAFGDRFPLGNGCCPVLGGGCLTFLQGQPWQGPGTGHASPCPRASRLRRALNARSCLLSSSARSGQYRSCMGRRR